MAYEVHGSDFSDDEFDQFFGNVVGLKVNVTGDPPDWIYQEALTFGRSNPKPDYHELRQHIDHSVAVARGWDHPWDRHEMFSMAVKSYYLIHWLMHLQEVVNSYGLAGSHLDLSYAYKMSFTPMFRDSPKVP